MEPQFDRRKVERNSAITYGSVRSGPNRWVPVAIPNISALGCKIVVSDKNLRLDDTVWIRIERLSAIQAIIRWIASGEAGIEFADPLHEAVVDHLKWPHHVQGTDEEMIPLDKFGRRLPHLGQQHGIIRSC